MSYEEQNIKYQYDLVVLPLGVEVLLYMQLYTPL